MTLTSHAIVGAAAAQFFPSNPVLAFSAGFVSHFVMDSLPHWDYELYSGKRDPNDPMNYDMVFGKKFFVDLFRIGFDAILGVVLSALIFTQINYSPFWIAVIGAIGGITPDPFQFLYWKIKREPLTTLQRFHTWIQQDKSLKVSPLAGILLQLIVVVPIIAIVQHLT